MARRSRYVIFLCTEEAFRSAVPATTAWYEYLFHSTSVFVLPLCLHSLHQEPTLHSTSLLCVYNHSLIFSLETLNLYWDSLLFRGGPKFSLRNNWKRIALISPVILHSLHNKTDSSAQVREVQLEAPCGQAGDGADISSDSSSSVQSYLYGRSASASASAAASASALPLCLYPASVLPLPLCLCLSASGLPLPRPRPRPVSVCVSSISASAPVSVLRVHCTA